MNELIPIITHSIGGTTVPACNGRELHMFLGVGKDYTNWIKAQIERARLIEHRDFEVYALLGEKPQGGRPSKEYALSIEAAKHISMMSGTERGFSVHEHRVASVSGGHRPFPDLLQEPFFHAHFKGIRTNLYCLVLIKAKTNPCKNSSTFTTDEHDLLHFGAIPQVVGWHSKLPSKTQKNPGAR